MKRTLPCFLVSLMSWTLPGPAQAAAANQAKARGGHIARGGRRAQRDVVTLNLKAYRRAGMQAKVAAQVARDGDLAFAGDGRLHGGGCPEKRFGALESKSKSR